MKFLTLPLKKKYEKEEQKHNPTSKTFLKQIITNSKIITFTTCGQTLKEIRKTKIGVKF